MADGQRAKVFVHPIVLTEHVFDKVRSIDMTLAEFNSLLTAHGVIIEATAMVRRSRPPRSSSSPRLRSQASISFQVSRRSVPLETVD